MDREEETIGEKLTMEKKHTMTSTTGRDGKKTNVWRG